MRKISAGIAAIWFLSASALALAHKDYDFSGAKRLIESNISCSNLTDDQLGMIGEYYMEQMHPGEAHEAMDQMMGGEGSESLRQAHINMAERFYCSENIYGMGGMMGMMNFGMMGSYGSWGIFSFLYLLLLAGLVVLVFLGIVKLWKSMDSKKKR